ncbi:MAG: FixH family protein [Alphaproteobacteria bacterium]|nr:FixH family protein [Alphaproteobacteria bacterium]
MTDLPQGEFRFTGRHMLVLVVGFFAVIVGVNVLMAVLAARSWTGLVVENSYVASQQFNDKLTVAQARTASGWQGGMDYADGELVFFLVDRDGAPVRLDDVAVEISRPIGVEGDRFVDLVVTEDGTHRAKIALDPGVWNAAIVARVPGEADYEHRARLIVR